MKNKTNLTLALVSGVLLLLIVSISNAHAYTNCYTSNRGGVIETETCYSNDDGRRSSEQILHYGRNDPNEENN